MSKLFKGFIVLLAALSLILCGFSVSAQATDEKLVNIEITTDKKEYSEGEIPKISYSVTKNTLDPSVEINNVVITIKPDKELEKFGLKGTTKKLDTLTDVTGVSSEMYTVAFDGKVTTGTTEISSILKIVICVVAVVLVGGIATIVFLKKSKRFMSLVLVFAMLLGMLASGGGLNIYTNAATTNRVTKTVTIYVNVLGFFVPKKVEIDVTYDLVVNDKVNYYEDNKVSNANKNNAPTGMKYIENEYIKLGANLDYGGAITFLQSVTGNTTENMINNYDLGRQIQMSMYSSPAPYYKPDHEIGVDKWLHLGWNPIQSGDVDGNSSRILAYYNDGECMYIKLRPMHWPQKDMPGECLFEVLYTLVENTVDVRCRFINEREDFTDEQYKQIINDYYSSSTTVDSIKNTNQFPARSQELPAVYTNGNFCNFITYSGMRPFQNEDVTVHFDASTPESQTENWRTVMATENWAALVNNDNFGLGIYNPKTINYSAGFVGEKANPIDCGDKSFNSGYMSPITAEILDHNIVYDYNYTLIVGDIEQIRERAYELNKNDKDDLNYDFSENRQSWKYSTNDDGYTITDAGYGNQNCLDFSFNKGGIVSGPTTFWNPDNVKNIEIDAEFTNATVTDFRIDAKISMYNGSTEVAEKIVTVPFKVKGDGVRRVYTVNLENNYEYVNGLGCTNIQFEFVSDSGAAKIYTINFGE